MILRGDVFSRALEMDTGLTVIVPNDFDADTPYAVCYVLHGLCGNSGNFADYTMLPVYAQDYRAVFVMPEVSRSFYADMRYGQKFFTYVAEELPRICRRVFNISAAREDTMVIGASMGGYGALKCALRRPDLYGRCCAFSSAVLFLREGMNALRTPQGLLALEAAYGEQLPVDFAAIFGDDLQWNPEDDLLELAKKAAAGDDKPRLYLACGDDDYFLPDHRRFAAELKNLGLEHDYVESPGGHDWMYFDGALRNALKWCFAL